MKPLAIYIHIPFCAKKCAYCDFASWSNREADWQRYFDSLWTEIRLWSESTDFGILNKQYRVKSVFIGGGTPTLVPAGYIVETLERLKGIAPFEQDAEITIEGNPGTLTADNLRYYRTAGLNRLSLGAQSFDNGLLRSLGRIHTSGQIRDAVAMAKGEGFSNINLDLMYALPEQTMDQWRDTLDRAIDLDVSHISAYSLIVEEGTPMAARVRRGEATLPDEDAVNAMQRTATATLAKANYGRYEISNYARPGAECRHNLTYWHRGDYLGLGCAAHSLMQDCRFANPVSLDAYLAGERRTEFQRLDRNDKMEETLMLATRTTRGLDLAVCQADFGMNLLKEKSDIVERLARAGLIVVKDGFLSLTERGMEVQDAVVLALLDE